MWLFISNTFEGKLLNRNGELNEGKGWDLFDLAKLVVLSVLHQKNKNAKGISSSIRNWTSLSRGSKASLNFQHVKKSFRISPNEVLK